MAALAPAARDRLDRLYDIRSSIGHTDPPPEMHAWLERTFGSVDSVRGQRMVKITNLVTLEATLFAPLRARRPMDGHAGGGGRLLDIAATEGDPFCDPETGTPADPFGRLRGRHVITGANAALADSHHAVLVFDRHDPLAFDAELVADVLATARAWAERAHDDDPGARNYMLIWNCLWRAGGSIVHGHAQALLGEGPHYARIERWRRDSASYAASQGGASLLDDIVGVHRDLGLAVEKADGVWTLAHLTPIKEREVIVVAPPGSDERDPAFAGAVGRALIALRDRVGVLSFNLALWRPPLGDEHRWAAVGPMVRIVDRGDLAARASDIGAMELYGTPIVGSDPWEVVASLG